MTKPDAKSQASTMAALNQLDRIFHEKARLGIMTSMVAVEDGMSFNELKEVAGLTDGNLNRHLKVLVDESMIGVKKTGKGRTTHSHYRITSKGRKSFEKYLKALEQILIAAKKTADGGADASSSRSEVSRSLRTT